MDLPDCPPGAEGYEDTVVSLPSKKIDVDEKPSTKAELEFQQHLNSLKIKVENGQYRCMVERRGRDSAGKWIYLCFPCAAMCSGEAILQTHLSGKKHKTKLSVKTVWPVSIFDEHPYYKEKENKSVSGKSTQASPMTPYELEKMYEKKRTVRCHIQDAIDGLKCPLLGLEYLIEYPPEESHHEPSYLCTLCMKQGAPRTIINHLTCFSHRYTFLGHNFPKAIALLGPYRVQRQYRQGVNVVIERLVSRVESKFGRLKPVNIDKEEYERDKEFIHQWIFNGFHFNESSGSTFEEVVDIGLLQSLSEEGENKVSRDPSPPKVPVPRPVFNKFTRPVGRQERRGNSINSLSDISDDEGKPKPPSKQHQAVVKSQRYHPYEKTRDPEPKSVDDKTHRPPNYQYKVNMAKSQQENAEENANKMLAYHEKNPEKHPLYPEEWKKFWNRRYKEIQAEGKDPSKHDFKPEWIVYWTSRMKELHNEELRVIVNEIYRKLRLTPPDTRVVDLKKHSPEPKSKLEPRRRSPESRRRSIDRKLIDRRRTPERRRSPDLHRRSPDRHRRSPPRFVDRRYSPVRRRSPERRRSPPRRKSPDLRRRSPERFMHDVRKRSVERRRSPERRYDNRSAGRDVRALQPRLHRTKSRSPLTKRSPARTFINLDSIRRSRSPLSLREDSLRNKSPTLPKPQEILVSDVSDDDLKPAPSNLSPWNSDIESIESIPESRSPIARSRTESVASSRRKEPRHHGHVADPKDLGPAENVVATLRLLVALEDHLGSLGPKIVDLLAEALKMEKEEANSSEQLLCRESALTLLETGKERLKGAVQAGLVGGAAAAAARAAVVRVAATLHYAETRLQKTKVKAPEVVPVAGVGAVDREQIALQMAAALVQQGKCDVSKQELEQLVDAVVGMAEAKKREAEGNRSVELKLKEVAAPQSQGASALQLLQSAYDENEKKPDRDEATEAMDRLSDSDLETLLKNFNELSAEEQHSLIAYLKKLEAKEPSRVERLRQYVSATVPIPQAPVEPEPEQKETNVMVIPSDDDDDYTVEEVFKSATEKVKENQIRQEMEVVKKSLETKSESASLVSNVVDISKNLSSATDLFALVQASLKSTAANAATTASAEVVSRTLQPRSFGDAQPLLADPKPTPLIPNLTSVSSEYAQPPPSKQTEEYGQPPPSNYNDNQPTDSFNQNQGHQWDINPQQWDNQGPAFNQNQSRNNQNQGWNNNQGSTSWNNQDKNWNDNQGQNWDKSNQEQPWDNNQGWNKQGGGNWNNQDANWDNQGSNWDNQESNNNWNNQGPSRDMNQGRNFNNQVPVWDNQKQDRCPHRGNFNQDNFNRGGGRGGHFVNGKNDNRNNQNHNFRGNRGGRGNFGQRGRGRGRGM